MEPAPDLPERIACPYCGVSVKAHRLVKHKNEKCPMNPAKRRLLARPARRKVKRVKMKLTEAMKRKLKLRTHSLDGSRSTSVWTVQGGLPGLGKR